MPNLCRFSKKILSLKWSTVEKPDATPQHSCRPDGLVLSFSAKSFLGYIVPLSLWAWKKEIRNCTSPSCLAEFFSAISSGWSPIRPYSLWSIHWRWLTSYSPEPFSHRWLSSQFCLQFPQSFLPFSLPSVHYFSLKPHCIPWWTFASFNFPGGIWRVYE